MTNNEIMKHKDNWIIDVAHPTLNNQNACLPLCIVLGMKLAKSNAMKKKKIYNDWIKNSKKFQKLLAEATKLSKQVNVNFSANGCSTLDIQKFYGCSAIKNIYSIYIYLDRANPRDRIKPATIPAQKTKVINIFLLDDLNHFILITDIRKFFGVAQYCQKCKLPHNNLTNHRCEGACPCCYSSTKCCDNNVQQIFLKCSTCNRKFVNQHCLEQHRQNKMYVPVAQNNVDMTKVTVCDLLQICNTCGTFVDYRKRLAYSQLRRWPEKPTYVHACGEYYCYICDDLVSFGHQCYIQKYRREKSSNYVMIFYDLECMQVQNNNTASLPDNAVTYTHKPNLVIADRVCNECIRESDVYFECFACRTTRRNIFLNDREANGVDCVTKFINFVFYQANTFYRKKTFILIAHNFQGYDSHFVMKSLMDNKTVKDKDIKLIMKGMKILKITVHFRYHFIDSLSFLQMSLAKFPKAFELKNLMKGYYPHLFNTEENFRKITRFPDQKYFITNGMSVNDKKKFEDWYAEQLNSKKVFNNRNELIAYCGDDVRILREGCVKFMLEFEELTTVNPFLEAFTLAGAVFIVYTKQFMTPNTLGIIKTGYSDSLQSVIGKLWLLHVEKQLQQQNTDPNVSPQIQKEFRLRENLLVDGYDAGSNTVYEFNGCWWHACNECYPIESKELFEVPEEIEMLHRREKCQAKADKIKSLGYNLVEKWECSFRSELKSNNRELEKELMNTPELLLGRLQPRHALFGGRTEVFSTYYKVKEGERIRYVDFCSLYPFVNTYGKYPIGHCKSIITGVNCKPYLNKIDEIEGFIQCQIIPPQTLRIPVLPIRCNSRLVFSLCRTCAEQLNINKCDHQNEERALIGTWALCEVQLALRKGYRLLNIFELWIYDTEQYDRETNTGGLFTNYMKTFLKAKQEASGWPDKCVDDQTKLDYLNEFKKSEGIDLEPENIKKNPAKRNIAKLCANSLWGKLVQRSVNQNVSVFHDISEFHQHINSANIIVLDVYAFEHKVWVSWKYVDPIDTELLKPSPRESITSGVFTTALARIKLYEEMDRLDSASILYCDTDSIIFVEKPTDQYTPKIGTCIGDLTDEIADKYGSTAYISEFTSAGPKTYAMRINFTDKTDCYEEAKCKGYTINATNSLTFDKVKSLVFGDKNQDETFLITHNPIKIKRKKHFRIESEPLTKEFRFSLNKRICIDNNCTVPFGYL